MYIHIKSKYTSIKERITMKHSFSVFSVLIIAAFILAACAPAATPMQTPITTAAPKPTTAPTATPAPKDIVDIAIADGRFTTLVAALQAAGLVDALKGDGPFTVFAPTDDAFKKLPAGTVESLLLPENMETLKSILLYHVVDGAVMASDVAKMTSAMTLQGDPVSIKDEMGKVYINDAQVVIPDIEALNGVIHVVDSVLLPPEKPITIVDVAIADGRFTTLAAALQATDLVDALKGEGPFTVFAPTDDAFAKLPAGTVESLLMPENLETLKSILLYHVADGAYMSTDLSKMPSVMTLQGDSVTIKEEMGKIYINDALVVIADIEASNGVIHVIDSVLLPPEKPGTIVDVAIADGRFTTLVAALQAANLVDTLNGKGPFTVFAPSDDAFKKLPAGTVESLLLPENLAKLKDILLYHVVSGKVMASDVVNLTSAMTVLGQNITITVKDGKVFLNDGTQVIITDVPASNGVIHVIDTVLLPK
jgi:transforming growth factor-beta-induced protein